MNNLEFIKRVCRDYIEEGEALLNTQWVKNPDDFITSRQISYVDLEKYTKWKSNSNILLKMLGDSNEPWIEAFKVSGGNTLINAKSILGGLKSIQEALSKDYLISIENLIFAEVFLNLIDQSEYLFDKNFFLASGVIARAVLEEKLKGLNQALKLSIAKNNPTLSDFNAALYEAKFYDKIEMDNVIYLISIGNDAVHAQPVTKEDIRALIDGVKVILKKYK